MKKLAESIFNAKHVLRAVSLSACVAIHSAFAIDTIQNRNQVTKSNDDWARLITNEQAGIFEVVANSANFGFGTNASKPESQGEFTGGILAAGTETLPNSTATYEGSIGIASGFVIATGLVSDTTLALGILGPNNGESGPNDGEVSEDFGLGPDGDFFQATGLAGNDPGDPSFIEFDVEVTESGWLGFEFAFATDEHPFYDLGEFNDSFAIIVDGENIATLRFGTPDAEPIQLEGLKAAGEIMDNLVAPGITGDHVVGSDHYKHEYAGFTRVMTNGIKLSPSTFPKTYSVKIVVQDVGDKALDSALFLPNDGITFTPLTTAQLALKADFNRDGDVDDDDYDILLANWERTQGVSHSLGDANDDGTVNFADYLILSGEY